MNRTGSAVYPWRKTLVDGARHYLAQREYLVNLLRHTSGHDSFVQYMTDINFEVLKQQLLSAGKMQELSEAEILYARIYCLGTVCLTCEWLLGKHRATPEEIAAIYEHSLSEPLRKYLTASPE